jgi:hypothetical protein
MSHFLYIIGTTAGIVYVSGKSEKSEKGGVWSLESGVCKLHVIPNPPQGVRNLSDFSGKG